MKFKLRPRPTGVPARAIFTEYDVPLDPAVEHETKYVTNDEATGLWERPPTRMAL